MYELYTYTQFRLHTHTLYIHTVCGMHHTSSLPVGLTTFTICPAPGRGRMVSMSGSVRRLSRPNTLPFASLVSGKSELFSVSARGFPYPSPSGSQLALDLGLPCNSPCSGAMGRIRAILDTQNRATTLSVVNTLLQQWNTLAEVTEH